MLAYIKHISARENNVLWKIAASGHSVRSFAKKAGVSKSSLSVAINGAGIAPQTAKKIADALGMKPEELFDFE
jgi:lambda repressor-like predicted transcriptional regulator